MALGLETSDAALVRHRITAAQVPRFLGAPAVDPADGLDRLREQVDAPGMPDVVRERGREVIERLAAWPRTDPEHAKQREYLRRLVDLPWTKRTAAPLDLARARTVLDAGDARHGAVKERLVDYIAVRLTKPDATAPLLWLVGPGGVGKSSLARLLAATLGRARAWLACGELNGAAAVLGAPSGPPGWIVDELRRVGVRNPMFVPRRGRPSGRRKRRFLFLLRTGNRRAMMRADRRERKVNDVEERNPRCVAQRGGLAAGANSWPYSVRSRRSRATCPRPPGAAGRRRSRRSAGASAR